MELQIQRRVFVGREKPLWLMNDKDHESTKPSL